MGNCCVISAEGNPDGGNVTPKYEKTSEHALRKNPSPLSTSATKFSDLREETNPSGTWQGGTSPSGTTPSNLSTAEEKEIQRLIRRASLDDTTNDVSKLSDEELRRLHYLLKKEQTTKGSCPDLTDKKLLSSEEMKKLGRVVRKEKKLRWGDVSVTDISMTSSSSSGLVKRHRKGRSSSSLWVPSSAEIESLLSKRPPPSSSSSIIMEILEKDKHGHFIKELSKLRSCSNISLCIHGAESGKDILPKNDIMWNISEYQRMKYLRRWSSADTLQVHEEYWLKNPEKPQKLMEDDIEKLLVNWRKMKEKILIAYTEGKAGIISIGKEILARGRISIVKQARLTRPEQATDMAVKLIELDKLPADYNLKMLRRELTIISALKHRHVLEVHSIFFYKQVLHILMELAPNGTLMEYIRENGVLNEIKAKQWLRELSEGLKYCHKEHVAHRDLTCENVLLDINYQIKITGFHLARLYKSTMPKCQRTCGTIEYTAPEVLTHQEYNPMKADIWSLGICLYVMFHGQPPFTDYQLKLYRLKEARKTLAKDEDVPQLLVPKFKPSLSKVAKHILSELLKENPSKRPSASELDRYYSFEDPPLVSIRRWI